MPMKTGLHLVIMKNSGNKIGGISACLVTGKKRCSVRGQWNKDFRRLSMHRNRHQAQISSKYRHLFGTWWQYKILAVGSVKSLPLMHPILTQRQNLAASLQTTWFIRQTLIEHLNYHRPQICGAPWRCERSCLTRDTSSNNVKKKKKTVDKNKTPGKKPPQEYKY